MGNFEKVTSTVKVTVSFFQQSACHLDRSGEVTYPLSS